MGFVFPMEKDPRSYTDLVTGHIPWYRSYPSDLFVFSNFIHTLTNGTEGHWVNLLETNGRDTEIRTSESSGLSVSSLRR